LYDKSRVTHEAEDGQASKPLCDQFQGFVQERAPWFAGKIEKFNWARQVTFERRLSKQFSKGRCWLLGDAAHQTSPVGVQSFNVGLREAEEFATVLEPLYDGVRQPEVAKAYDRRWREHWHQLFGSNGWPKMYGDVDDWVKRRAARIVSCCPASGNQLGQLLKQVELALP
jgi:2-polyprenyl-6-methoxyphenol hydroxylase-like FAD-dependent oxidoreductase